MAQQAPIYSASLKVTDSELPAVRRNLAGFIDLHLHLAPDQVVRTHDDLQFAEQAEKIGYRGFVLKDHFTGTSGRAYTVSKLFPKLEISGGIALNRAVGGLNPDAVDEAIRLGAKQVWMPTFDSVHHFEHFGMFSLPGLVPVRDVKRERSSAFKGLSVLDSDKQMKPEVSEILSLVADSDLILGTGHLSLEEIFELVDAAGRAGVKKMLVTHPEFQATMWPASAQVELASKGALMEHCANVNYDAALTARNIKDVGADRCVLSSDSGQVRKGHPASFMSKFIDDLMAQGITEGEIAKMTVENPARLLGVD